LAACGWLNETCSTLEPEIMRLRLDAQLPAASERGTSFD
jgi:hypothetical protein